MAHGRAPPMPPGTPSFFEDAIGPTIQLQDDGSGFLPMDLSTDETGDHIEGLAGFNFDDLAPNADLHPQLSLDVPEAAYFMTN